MDDERAMDHAAVSNRFQLERCSLEDDYIRPHSCPSFWLFCGIVTNTRDHERPAECIPVRPPMIGTKIYHHHFFKKFECRSIFWEIFSDLFGEDVIGETSDRRSVCDEIRDGFHNIPTVFPPSETGKCTKLNAHESQTDPSERCRSSLSSSHN